MRDLSASQPKVIHYGRWRVRFTFGVVATALAVFLWFKGDDAFARCFGLASLGPIGLFCFIMSETRFDSTRRVVEHRRTFLGILTLRRRQWPLAEFRQIGWRSVGSLEEGAGRTWKVALERSSGQRLVVNYFDVSRNCTNEDARQFAVELSKLTGLPLSDEIAAG